MLQDLDSTLKTLLTNGELGLQEEIVISFSPPNESFEPMQPTVNLFLYDVKENWELRRNDWVVERDEDGVLTKKRSPARVDCSYLISAWPKESMEDSDGKTLTPQQAEHYMLGEVMKVLLRYRQLPKDVLQGSLENQTPPLRAKAMQPSNLQSLGEFWQAMKREMKTTLHYTVTISVDLSEPEEMGPEVTEKVIKLKTPK